MCDIVEALMGLKRPIPFEPNNPSGKYCNSLIEKVNLKNNSCSLQSESSEPKKQPDIGEISDEFEQDKDYIIGDKITTSPLVPIPHDDDDVGSRSCIIEEVEKVQEEEDWVIIDIREGSFNFKHKGTIPRKQLMND
jgi:hypothetical protein